MAVAPHFNERCERSLEREKSWGDFCVALYPPGSQTGRTTTHICRVLPTTAVLGKSSPPLVLRSRLPDVVLRSVTGSIPCAG
jgi:hypothetical protein